MFFAWTPLVQASDFTGIQTDVLTTVTGVVTLGVIVAGFGIIWKIFSR